MKLNEARFKTVDVSHRSALIFAKQADNETHDGHDGENKKKNFGYFNGPGCNSTKSKNSGDQCDHQKNDRIVQHPDFLGFNETRPCLINPNARLNSLALSAHR
jgi:hypothetical protein